MDRNKTIDLIKSYVLGCLGSDNESGLKAMMEDAENFPWRELGQYQNLAALIPLNLNPEIPEPVVKERITKMLNDLKDTAKTQQKIQTDEPALDQNEFSIEDNKLDTGYISDIDQVVLSEDPGIESPVNLNEFNEYGDISHTTEMSEDEKILVEEPNSVTLPVPEKSERRTPPLQEEHRRGGKMKEIMEREDGEKRMKEYINTYYQKKFEDLQEETKKALYIAIAGVSLATLAAILAIVM